MPSWKWELQWSQSCMGDLWHHPVESHSPFCPWASGSSPLPILWSCDLQRSFGSIHAFSGNPLRRQGYFRPLIMSKNSHESLIVFWLWPCFLIHGHFPEEFSSWPLIYLSTYIMLLFVYFVPVLWFADVFSVIMCQNCWSVNVKQVAEMKDMLAKPAPCRRR